MTRRVDEAIEMNKRVRRITGRAYGDFDERAEQVREIVNANGA